ncbi:hypothetical protein RQP46_009426 [Phenoliferia psychrophenolica]
MHITGNAFVITGGLGGVGKAVAAAILAEGGFVALFDVVPQEKGETLTAELDATRLRAFYASVDISDPESVKTAVDAVVSKLPAKKLVGAVHCAGIALRREWTNTMADSIKDFKKMLDVNTFGTFVINAYVSDAINAQYPANASKLPARRTVQGFPPTRQEMCEYASYCTTYQGGHSTKDMTITSYFLSDYPGLTDICADGGRVIISHLRVGEAGQAPIAPFALEPFLASWTDKWREQFHAHFIINFASAAASPYARVLCYGPTKTAVLGITASVSDYLGPSGIRVNSISPSIVATGMAGPHMPYFQKELDSAATFPRRQAHLDEIWHGVKFLIENGMVNGLDVSTATAP